MIRETRFEVPLGNKWVAKRALKSRSESNESRNALWSPARNKWVAKRALKSRSESNESWNALWSPARKQMIRETRFEVPLETNESQNALWSPALSQMSRETRFEVPLWIKWFAKRALKSRSESNDLWSDWSASKQWIILPCNALIDSEFDNVLCSLSQYNLFVVWITGKWNHSEDIDVLMCNSSYLQECQSLRMMKICSILRGTQSLHPEDVNMSLTHSVLTFDTLYCEMNNLDQ